MSARNERAVIMFLSYIIGFNAAFIGFGLPNFIEVQPSGEIITAISNLKDLDKNASKFALEEEKNVITYTDEEGDFYAKIDGEERLLSIRSFDFSSTRPGMHAKIVASTVSNDGGNIYYCEARSTIDDSCAPLIYNIDSGLIQSVNIENSSTTEISIDDMTIQWTEDGHLMLNGFRSADPSQPWFLMRMTD